MLESAAIGLLISIFGLIFKLISSMKTELKDRLIKEAAQNENVSKCLHQIELLEVKIDNSIDKFNLADNGLLERIKHSKERLGTQITIISDALDEYEKQLADMNRRLSVIENQSHPNNY